MCTDRRSGQPILEEVRRHGLWSLTWASTRGLFDQSTAFGRLAFVHVVMMAGDTMVTISLAGSLFFSVTPTEAKGKVLAYLLLTIAPFAVVSPLLGPLIDRSSNGRRFIVALSALARVVLCYFMSRSLKSFLLFPEAFLVLVFSKLYVVTRGALVPEMVRADWSTESRDPSGWSSHDLESERGFAGFNAQLTLLGTVVGIIGGFIGVGILKSIGATSVLITASLIFIVGTVAGLRLRRGVRGELSNTIEATPLEKDLNVLRPHGDVEVRYGLIATSTVRFAVGFETFLLAFVLRRENASVGLFAAALILSALGALGGLGLVTRVRSRLAESTMLSIALLGVGIGTLLAARFASNYSQVALSAWLGAAAAIAQPSFDAITQRDVPESAQGRTFARFAVRQQLLWVIGATIPVAIAMSFATGDVIVATLVLIVGVFYVVGRRSAT
jgi:hypothetical protein